MRWNKQFNHFPELHIPIYYYLSISKVMTKWNFNIFQKMNLVLIILGFFTDDTVVFQMSFCSQGIDISCM